jgi:hypothetical protein
MNPTFDKLTRIAEIIEGKLLAITQNYDEKSYDNDGWWIIGNAYLYLFNQVKYNECIVDDKDSMDEMVKQIATEIAYTYRDYSERIDELDEEEQGFFTLMFGFLYLFRLYMTESRTLH